MQLACRVIHPGVRNLYKYVHLYSGREDDRNLRYCRQFYLYFPDQGMIWNARVPNLTWSHYRTLLWVPDAEARAWYLNELKNRYLIISAPEGFTPQDPHKLTGQVPDKYRTSSRLTVKGLAVFQELQH